MDPTPLVVYHGPEAAAIEKRWAEADRPFDLLGAGPDATLTDVLAERRVDALVVDGGPDPLAVVDRVRADLSNLPVVLFDDGSVPATEALECDVTHYVRDDGDRVALLASMTTLFERARTERRERTMLESLLEHLPLSVYFKDCESRYVRVSDAMLTMTGPPYIENPEGKRFASPEDVRGTTEFDLFPSELAEAALEDDERVMDTGDPLDNKIEHVYGSVLEGTFVATSKAPWYDDRGNLLGLLGVTRDISDRKQTEHRLERQNERLDRFASVVSHDLRNPLEVAQGRLALARADGDAEHFDAVERSLDRMSALIDDVLTLARQGEAVDDPERVAIDVAAEEAWALVDSGEATLAVDTDMTVEADPSRLRRLFENLFRNAIEHGGRPDVTVTVADLRGDQGFIVADDGAGIPPAEREKVFESGFTTGEEGTGLGLNIVQTIADAHGWHVTVGDSADGGTAFTFEIGQ